MFSKEVLSTIFWVFGMTWNWTPVFQVIDKHSNHYANIYIYIYIYIYIKTISKIYLKNILYTCKQPLMMACERSENVWDNFGKFIHQFQHETKTLIRKLERILIKLCIQNVSIIYSNMLKLYIYIISWTV